MLQPSEMTDLMMAALYQPEQNIAVTGTDGHNEPVSLEFDKSKNILVKKENGNSEEIKLADMPLFMRLFFFSADKKSPESWEISSKSLKSALSSAGINTGAAALSVSDFDGNAVFAIGKEKRFTEGNCLEISKESKRPVMLKTGDETYIFSDYHRSVLPLVFPGNIKFFKNGVLQNEWIFLRDEYKQK